MSLKSFLEIEEINERFQNEFSKPHFSAKLKLVVPTQSPHQKLIKAAFKYLMSFKLEKHNKNFENQLITAQMALEMAKINGSNQFLKKAEKIIEKAEKNLSHYNDQKYSYFDKALIESSFFLAQLDLFLLTSNETIIKPSTDDLNELKKMICAVNPLKFSSDKIFLWEPSFESARLVGGANIDMILDDTIIILNFSDKINFSRDIFNELIGLYTLSQIGTIKGLKNQSINKVGIYFTRYSFLQIIPLNSIINPKTFPNFKNWFEEKALEKYY